MYGKYFDAGLVNLIQHVQFDCGWKWDFTIDYGGTAPRPILWLFVHFSQKLQHWCHET